MKKIVLIAISIFASFTFVLGQDLIDKQYLKSVFDEQPVKEKKAKLVRYNYNESGGVIRSEYRNIKNNGLVQIKRYKNDIPFGTWVFYIKGAERKVTYQTEDYDSIPKYDIKSNSLISTYTGKFIPPRLKNNTNHISIFIAKNIRYPLYAQEKKIQGTVLGQFVIDENGDIQDITIKKSAHQLLDLEAMRVMRRFPKFIPAKIDGNKIEVQVEVPISFKLGNR